jgi:hypothetical protein
MKGHSCTLDTARGLLSGPTKRATFRQQKRRSREKSALEGENEGQAERPAQPSLLPPRSPRLDRPGGEVRSG